MKTLRTLMFSVLLGSVMVNASPRERVGKLTLGGQFGFANTSTPGDRALGWAVLASHRPVRFMDVTALFSGQENAQLNGQLYFATLGFDFHPLDDTYTLEPVFAVGPGMYFYGGDLNGTARLGLHFGAGLDVVINQFRVGLQSRYHVVMNAPVGADFWDMMFRFGYDFHL